MYRFTSTGGIQRVADGAIVPADPTLSEYQNYLDWLGAGNIPEPAESPQPPTPEQQIEDLLRIAGVTQDWHLDAMMAGMVALASTQGLTEAQLYAVNPGYRQVKDVAEQIKALRDQL
jgi:hypothetical protein